MKKIKVYDYLEMKTVLVNIDDVKDCYQNNKIKYDSLDDFMACHFISKKHKNYILGKEETTK